MSSGSRGKTPQYGEQNNTVMGEERYKTNQINMAVLLKGEGTLHLYTSVKKPNMVHILLFNLDPAAGYTQTHLSASATLRTGYWRRMANGNCVQRNFRTVLWPSWNPRCSPLVITAGFATMRAQLARLYNLAHRQLKPPARQMPTSRFKSREPRWISVPPNLYK